MSQSVHALAHAGEFTPRSFKMNAKQKAKIIKANLKSEITDLKTQRNAEMAAAGSDRARDAISLRYGRIIGQVETAYKRQLRNVRND